MAPNVTIVGRATRVRGRVTGAASLEIRGLVEGEVAVGGDVTIDATGMVGAGVRGRKLVVRGAVKGDLIGEESVLLEDGSRVVGDVRAPRVAIAPGALVRGYVQTGQGGEKRAPAPRAQAVAAAPKPAAHVAHVAHVPGAAPKPAARHAAPAAQAVARRPPPPIVPALKKAKGQIAKKREH